MTYGNRFQELRETARPEPDAPDERRTLSGAGWQVY